MDECPSHRILEKELALAGGMATSEAAAKAAASNGVTREVGEATAQWASARAYLEKKQADDDLARELLSSVKDRTLVINVMGKDLQVRCPTIRQATQMGEKLTRIGESMESLEGKEGVTPEELEVSEEEMVASVKEMAAWFLEPTHPELVANLGDDDASLEVAMSVVIESIGRFGEAQKAIAGFRHE